MTELISELFACISGVQTDGPRDSLFFIRRSRMCAREEKSSSHGAPRERLHSERRRGSAVNRRPVYQHSGLPSLEHIGFRLVGAGSWWRRTPGQSMGELDTAVKCAAEERGVCMSVPCKYRRQVSPQHFVCHAPHPHCPKIFSQHEQTDAAKMKRATRLN